MSQNTPNAGRPRQFFSPTATDNDGIGPDLNILPGQIGEIVIEGIIEDLSKTGYTATVYGGGILSLRLVPQAQRTHRSNAGTTLRPDRHTAILRALETWPESAPCSLRRHAAALGVSLAELKKACFTNPGRAQPPLRDDYERARLRWKNNYNDRRNGRPA